jgi:hypothetical protein
MKILRNTDKKNKGVAYTAKLYKISKKRYYQIHSEMLQACYRDLIPNDGVKVLLSLGNKQLFRHFFYEMKRQEAWLKKSGNKKKLEEYYFKILTMRHLFIIKEKMQSELLDEFDKYASLYVQIKTPDMHDSEIIRIRAMAREELKFETKGYSVEKKNFYANELEKISRKVFAGSNVLAKFLVSDLLMLTFAQYNFDNKTPEQYALYGKNLLAEHPDEFAEIRDFYIFECAQHLPQSELSAIIAIEEFLERSAQQYGPSIYFIGRFFVQIILSDRGTWAKKYMKEHFPYKIEMLKKEPASNWAFLCMLYHTYTENYMEAELYLQKANSFNSGSNKVLPFEKTLRCFDTFFAAMRGNAYDAEKTANRHLRYIKAHGYRDHKRLYYFIKFTIDLLKIAPYDSDKAIKIKEAFWDLKEVQSFRYLFDKIYGKYFPK